MARVALKPSRAVADLLRSKREQLGLSLRQIEKKTEEAGEIIPFPTLAKVEQGRVDPGVRRLQLLLRIYRVPFQLVSDLVELENFAGKLPRASSAKELFDEGIALWKAGDGRKAVACLIALQKQLQDEPENTHFRQKAMISFAVMAASLGKYHLSQELVGKLLLEGPQPDLLVSVLVQAGVCWDRLGSGEAALAFLERAHKHVGPNDHRERGWVLHQKASTLAKLGEFREATLTLRQALSAYRKADDAYGECKALTVHARILGKQGDARGALEACRRARAHAEAHGFTRLRVLRTIDEGQALLALGDAAGSVALFRAALAEAVNAEDRVAEFHAHHGLWKAYAALDQLEQAAFELRAARHYLRFVHERSEETEEVRAQESEPGRARRRFANRATGT